MPGSVASLFLLNPDQCQRAARTHDPRFDGIFFIGIITTRIYCSARSRVGLWIPSAVRGRRSWPFRVQGKADADGEAASRLTLLVRAWYDRVPRFDPGTPMPPSAGAFDLARSGKLRA